MNTFLLINWIAFLLVIGYAGYLFTSLVKSRYAAIKRGKKAEWTLTNKERLDAVLVNVFGQKKLLKDKKSGAIHVMMFYGFLLVQFGAIDFIWKGLAVGQRFPHVPLGPLYPIFTFFQEIVMLVILIAVVWGFYRRYVEKLVRLKRNFMAGLALIFIGGLMVAVLFGNGFFLVYENHSTLGEPVASSIAFLFSWVPESVAFGLFVFFWWAHLLFLLSFMVYIPQGKHAHLIAGTANVWLGRTSKVGRLAPIDLSVMEEAEDDEAEFSFGVNRIEDFNQKQLVDLYACVECGRCTNMCPASGTGKMLSPMDLIVKLRDHLNMKTAAITQRSPWAPAFVFEGSQGNQIASLAAAGQMDIVPDSLIGNVITEEEIWACTTCRNCEDQCPVMNEHVDKIIDLRRHLVMMEGKMDPEMQRTMANIERQGNPWGMNRKERENWRKNRDELVVPTAKEKKKAGEDFEYLFWVGAMGSYDNRSQKIAMAFARILNEADISFAILGNDEKNSGDTPRRIGNEVLFQELAEANIKSFEKYGVKKIVTIDPHAYNTFKNEYPDFGLSPDVEVYHHTELLARLIDEKRITPLHEVKERVVYHDSCYLGRYNDIYDAPRYILEKIPGITLVETERNREKGMCCGAGGGMMWQEEKVGARVNVARTEQLLTVQPSVIGSACPYCLTMLSDGTKAKEVDEAVATYDVVELLERSIVGIPVEEPVVTV